MAITYTWSITSMKVRDETVNGTVYPGAVIQTYWEKTGTDEDGNTGMFAGATPFNYSGEGEFTELANLTEAQVLGWIQDVVVGSYEEHVNEQIQRQIDEAKNPIVEPDLPWASDSE